MWLPPVISVLPRLRCHLVQVKRLTAPRKHGLAAPAGRLQQTCEASAAPS